LKVFKIAISLAEKNLRVTKFSSSFIQDRREDISRLLLYFFGEKGSQERENKMEDKKRRGAPAPSSQFH
jgi:hypothetical protein